MTDHQHDQNQHDQNQHDQNQDDLDDALLRELAGALDDVPPGALAAVAARGRAAFTWQTIDEDLLFASLSFDSADPELAGAGPTTRAGGESRLLEFTAALRSVEVEVHGDRIEGQFIPPGPGRVRVERERGEPVETEVSELGFFEVRPVPRGVVRFRCSASGSELVSDWVLL